MANEDLPCELWLNKGNDTFANIGTHLFNIYMQIYLDIVILGSVLVKDCGLVKGMVFTDYNDDMWPDIMLSRYSMSNRLLRNDGALSTAEPGKWSFTDVSKEAGIEDPWFSFPTTTFDVDQGKQRFIYLVCVFLLLLYRWILGYCSCRSLI